MRVVAICTEDHPGYPDPLIMTAEVDRAEDIEDAMIQQRLDDLEGVSETEIRAT